MRGRWSPGQVVDRYALTRLLGRGGLGEVWQAHDEALDRLVAIKIIHPGMELAELTDRFASEARIVARLNHPSIVQVLNVGREGDTPYIVMQYINGPSLYKVLEGGPISTEKGLPILIEIGQALLYAHQLNVLHRDVKPGNILIDSATGRGLLSDFGTAKTLDEGASLTMTGVVVGTPTHLAPEVMLGGEASVQSDIFSYGVTAYETFTGQRPYDVRNPFAWMRDPTKRPKAPSRIQSQLPKEMDDILLRLLAIEPGSRHSSFEEIIPLLEALARRFPVSPAARPLKIQVESPPKPLEAGDLTSVGERPPPTGFFTTTVFPKSAFFGDEAVRYNKIQESLTFYRDHLSDEYKSLLRQAKVTFHLWLFCVCLGFLLLVASIVSMLVGRIQEGAATAAATSIVYFVQKIFHQREDHYRALAAAKNAHLEYGNQWLLVIQSIDAIVDEQERGRRQAQLVKIMTDKLGLRQGAPNLN